MTVHRTAADPDVGDLAACNDAVMPDRELSEALQTYVWGTAGLPWPSERPDALQADQQRLGLTSNAHQSQ
jgi:hypothetical protein